MCCSVKRYSNYSSRVNTIKRHLWGKWVFLIIGIGIWAACTSDEQTIPIEVVQRQDNPLNYKKVDSLIAMIQSGDLVFRTGADMTSYMLRQLNLHEKMYSHCGIAIVENGQVYVYHSIGGEDNPDEKLRKEPAQVWFSPVNNLGGGVARLLVQRLNHDSLAALLHAWHSSGKKFDMKFDLSTDDRLYCSEMVYKAFNKILQDTTWLKPVNMFGYSIMPIDHLYRHKLAKFICRVEYK